MFNVKKHTTGYSLVEVLVAISVLMIAIVGPMTIASKGLQNAQLAREQSTAAFLAQEGIELVHLRRYNAALEYYASGNPAWDWAATEVAKCDTVYGCAVDIDQNGEPTITACASDLSNCRLYLSNSGRIRYTTVNTGQPSEFTRQIFITEPGGTEQVQVSSLITWFSTFANSDRELKLQTVISNYYGQN